MVTIDARRDALEEIRYADRLIGSAMGTFQSLKREQVLDMVGYGSDGFFNEHDRRDNTAAIRDVIEAEAGFRRALKLLGREPDRTEEDLDAWAISDDALGTIFDVIQMIRASANLSRAGEIHQRLVEVFESVRASDPALYDIQPLADWDTSLGDAVDAAVRFNPAVRFEIGSAIVSAVIGAVVFVAVGTGVLCGWIDPFAADEPQPEERPLPKPQARELAATAVPPALVCAKGTECTSRCSDRDVCHAFEVDLDGDAEPEWILAGYDHPGEGGLGARPFSASTVEVFRADGDGYVRIGGSMSVGAEVRPEASILDRRKGHGLQPVCISATLYDIDGREGATRDCFEFEGDWHRVD
jgi:hypothetical protein